MAGCAKGVDGRAHGAQACGGDVLCADGCVARRVVRLRAPPAPEAALRSARLRSSFMLALELPELIFIHLEDAVGDRCHLC